ncbi:MAG: neuromedin U [Acidobacteria bacterium]|nr:neuromedin U [Acidobacteriota bacterium]
MNRARELLIITTFLAVVLGIPALGSAQNAAKCDPTERHCPKIEKKAASGDTVTTENKTAETESGLFKVDPRFTPAKFVPDQAVSTAKNSKADTALPIDQAAATGDITFAQAKMEAQQQAAQDPDALRKAAQNPIASLISVPLQNNTTTGVGPDGDRVQNVFVAQPVVPVRLTSKVNMIMRFVTPVIYQPNTFPPTPAVPSGQFGLGDINPSFFFSPAKAGKVIWGVGPTFIIPTATGTTLGQGKLQIGPTAVVLVQPKKWTFGFLVNNTWSVAGKSNRPATNQGIFQYFINYNLKKGYYLTWQPTITFNWKATGSERWLVPFGGGVGRIMKLGNQPVNISVQAYANPVRQPNAGSFTLRFQFTLLYPKK